MVSSSFHIQSHSCLQYSTILVFLDIEFFGITLLFFGRHMMLFSGGAHISFGGAHIQFPFLVSHNFIFGGGHTFCFGGAQIIFVQIQQHSIAFRVTEVRRSRGEDQDTCFTYYVKADGLKDMQITTKARVSQFSSARPTQQTFLFVRPWNRCNLGLPDFVNDKITTTRPSPGSPGLSDQCSEVDSMSPAWSQSPEPRAQCIRASAGQPSCTG